MNLNELIAAAYAEDIPQGDLTTDNLHLRDRVGDARLVAKEDLVLSGREVFEQCVHHISPTAQCNWQFKDADFILKQQTVVWLRGNLLELLKAERVALIF